MYASSLSLLAISAAVSAFPVYMNNGYNESVMDPMENTTLAPYPTYQAVSNFDYASLNLALYQEWIELDLFNYGLAIFNDSQFQEAGMSAQDTSLLRFMAQQEVGHAQLIADLLGNGHAEQCTYNYSGAWTDVRSYIDFNIKVTRWGESGVLGFLSKLNSQDSAQLLQQSIHTEARQQMAFRQFAGAFPMPVYFETGIPQSWSWTLLSPWIQSCPANTPKVQWSIYPTLNIEANPVLAKSNSTAALSTNETAFYKPGDILNLTWDDAGKAVGPNKNYTTVKPANGTAQYALFVSQLNATYAPLQNISGNTASVVIPSGNVFQNVTDPIINGTMFIAITSENPYVSAYNLTKVNSYMVAGPAIFVAG